MPRISAKFAELKLAGQSALISYVMAGFPDEKATLSAVSGLVRGGADIIELGFPFSDPLADGPVIQNASAVSLSGGASTGRFLKTVRKIRARTDVPLVLMTYANILHRRGYERFVSDAVDAGIDGFIIPDMPVEEAAEYKRASRGRADTIFLVSPNTDRARIRRIAQASEGFLYMVAVYGTTGAKTGVKEYAIRALRDVKKQAGSLPVGVGFGVSTPNDVRRYVRAGADAVIVGSAYLRIMEKTPPARLESKIATFTRLLKKQTISS